MKLLVLANPVAGGGRVRRDAERLARRIGERGHGVELHFTRGPGDAGETAGERQRAGAADRIVVAGGDGTVNEVLNHLADPSRTPLTQLARGTANILSRELGLPREPEALADVALGEHVRRLDLASIRPLDGARQRPTDPAGTPTASAAPAGEARPHRFLLLASCGFDAQVVHVIGRTRRATLGFAGYVRPVLRTLAAYRPPALGVEIDGRQHAAQLVVVSNVRNYGGLFRVTDRAAPDSGHLDVCLCARARRRDMLRYGWAARRGRLSRLAGVRFEAGRTIRIASDAPVPVQVDGDPFGVTPVEIGVEPRVVPVLVPAEGIA